MFGSDRNSASSLFARAAQGWLNAVADLASADPRRFAGPGEAAGAADLPPGSARNSVGAEFVLPMGQAMIIAANRSASYWFNLAQILGSYSAKSIQTLGVEESGGGAGERVAVDDLRGLLREVGDLATREARLLQSEFGSLAESVAASFQSSDAPGAYHRRWRSKV
jgi:hypothetical protein